MLHLMNQFPGTRTFWALGTLFSVKSSHFFPFIFFLLPDGMNSKWMFSDVRKIAQICPSVKAFKGLNVHFGEDRF